MGGGPADVIHQPGADGGVLGSRERAVPPPSDARRSPPVAQGRNSVSCSTSGTYHETKGLACTSTTRSPRSVEPVGQLDVIELHTLHRTPPSICYMRDFSELTATVVEWLVKSRRHGAPTTRRCEPIRPNRPAAESSSPPINCSSTTATPAPPSPPSPNSPASPPRPSTSPSAANAACSKASSRPPSPDPHDQPPTTSGGTPSPNSPTPPNGSRAGRVQLPDPARTRPIHAIIRGAADKEAFAATLERRLLNERLTAQTERIRRYLTDALRPGLSDRRSRTSLLRPRQPRALPPPHCRALLDSQTAQDMAHPAPANRPARHTARPARPAPTTAHSRPPAEELTRRSQPFRRGRPERHGRAM